MHFQSNKYSQEQISEWLNFETNQASKERYFHMKNILHDIVDDDIMWVGIYITSGWIAYVIVLLTYEGILGTTIELMASDIPFATL